MNYKLVNRRFTKLNERSGLIENNTNGFIEIVITNLEENPNEIKSTTICPNGKMIYSLKETQNIWGMSISRIYSMINVLPLNMDNIGTKVEVDNKTIDINSKGQLEILGFNKVTKENMRLKTILKPNGEIGIDWYEPSSEGNLEDIKLELNNKVDKTDIMTVEQAKDIINKYKGE